MAAVVFLGAALVDVLWPETPSTVSVEPANTALSQEAAAQAPSAATPAAPTVSTTAASAVAPDLPPVVAAAPAVSSAPAAQPAAAVTASFQPPAGDGTVLRLAFEQQSWVQIRDATGKVVLEALNPPGSSREITARPPLTLIVGNAPGVHLMYGNRAIDLAPHTHVSVARLTLE